MMIYCTQYIFYGGCDVGIAFPTITLIFSSVLVLLSVSSWLDVGLLPPSLVSVYLILMCWQALTSNPDKNCETNTTNEDTDSRSVIYSAFLAAFSMTWTR
jgi:hypothetical protein